MYNHRVWEVDFIKRRKYLTIRFVWIMIVVLSISAIPDVIYGYTNGLIASLIAIVGFLTIGFFINKTDKRLPIHVLLVFLSWVIFYFSGTLGYEGQSHLYFIFLILAAGFVIEYSRIKELILHYIHIGVLYVILYVNDFKLIENNTIDEYVDSFGHINFWLTYLLTAIGTYIIARTNYKYEYSIYLKNKNLEERNETLEQLNKNLDDFVYHVSHDLKSPLASLKGLMILSDEENDLKKRNEYRELQYKSLHRMEKFIHDLLSLSRNRTNEITPEPIRLEDLVHEVFEQNKYEGDAQRIKMISKCKQEIVSDKTRLTIILNNLISNSVRYHNYNQPDPFIMVTCFNLNRQFVIEVKDNGLGIKQEHQKQIFDMFYKASENSKGSGLGLYITKEMVEMLGGRIELESEVGVGSTFRILLPE